MAEWTGLEPATPGVTGRDQKPATAREVATFQIPKSPITAQHLRGAVGGYSKVF